MFARSSQSVSKIVKKTSDFAMVNPLTKDADLEPGPDYKMKSYGPGRSYWLYALKLADGKYYVGFTRRYNPYDRIMQHVEGVGDGAKWTELHPPIEVIEIRNIERTSLARIMALEQNLTWEYMKIYGANSVRGGMVNYAGMVVRFGDRILMGYFLETIFCMVLIVILFMYILLRHYFNWW
jgi:predicted GIY-YIG superfamily endonuclease